MAVSLPRTRLGGRDIPVIGTHHVALDPAVRGRNLLAMTRTFSTYLGPLTIGNLAAGVVKRHLAR